MFASKPGVVVVYSADYGSIVQHSHEFVEMVYIESGQGISLVGQKFVNVSKGDLFLIADQTISHSVQPLEGTERLKMVNIIFPFEYFEMDYSAFNPLRTVNISKIPNGKVIIDSICKEYQEKKPRYDKIVYALTMSLICYFLREQSKTSPLRGVESKVQADGYIDTAVEYIHANYDKRLSADMIARECGLCKAYMQRIFRRERNTTIKEYIIKYRIEQSCKLLLTTDYTVAVIAEMVGFFSLEYFYSKFRTIVGVSPKTYRQKKEGDGKI